MAAGSVFLFFVPFQIPKRTRQRSREINSIRLEKAKLPHQRQASGDKRRFGRKNLENRRQGLSLCQNTRLRDTYR